MKELLRSAPPTPAAIPARAPGPGLQATRACACGSRGASRLDGKCGECRGFGVPLRRKALPGAGSPPIDPDEARDERDADAMAERAVGAPGDRGGARAPAGADAQSPAVANAAGGLVVDDDARTVTAGRAGSGGGRRRGTRPRDPGALLRGGAGRRARGGRRRCAARPARPGPCTRRRRSEPHGDGVRRALRQRAHPRRRRSSRAVERPQRARLHRRPARGVRRRRISPRESGGRRPAGPRARPHVAATGRCPRGRAGARTRTGSRGRSGRGGGRSRRRDLGRRAQRADPQAPARARGPASVAMRRRGGTARPNAAAGGARAGLAEPAGDGGSVARGRGSAVGKSRRRRSQHRCQPRGRAPSRLRDRRAHPRHRLARPTAAGALHPARPGKEPWCQLRPGAKSTAATPADSPTAAPTETTRSSFSILRRFFGAPPRASRTCSSRTSRIRSFTI